MKTFVAQALGNYRAYSVPTDPMELILDKVVNPAWFIALFSILAGYALPGRDRLETLLAVAVLYSAALVAQRAPEVFRAEALTNVLPAVVLSARRLPYLVVVRITPLFAEGLAVFLAAFLGGLLLYEAPTAPQALAGLGYGLLALSSLGVLSFLFSALSLLIEDYNLLSNVCWSAVVLFSGAMLPGSIYPDDVCWQLIQFAVPGNASLAALHGVFNAGAPAPGVAVTLVREATVCLVYGAAAALIFRHGLRYRLERV